MKKIWVFIRQLVCIHKFECVHDVWNGSAIPWFKCRMCEKEEGL